MENKIALLIDCDNISFKVIDSILKELEQYGEVIIKRAYGNWRSDGLKNWLGKLTELSIKPIHQIDYTKGKNATDMAIVIDAMDLLHLKKVNSFAIVSSDSDFTPLTMKIMEEDFKVYCFGNSQTPISLKNSCSIFTDIQSLFTEDIKNAEEPKVEKCNKTKLREKSLQLFNKISPNNDYISMEKINQVLKENGIDYKNYHFKQFKVFIDDLNLFQIHINEKNQGFLKLKNIPKDSKAVRLSKEEILADQKLKNCLCKTYAILSEKQKEVHLSTFFNSLSLNHRFNHKTYGYSTFKDFLYEIDLFNFIQKDEQAYIIIK
jgi:hypothetical protein